MDYQESDREERQLFVNDLNDVSEFYVLWEAYPLTHATFIEALSNFLDGRYISTILLSQAFVEQVIRHRCGIGRDFMDFPNVLKIAQEKGFIPVQRFNELNGEIVAISRKSYAHVPIKSKDMSLETVQKDAYSAIKIASEFLGLLINTWEILE